MSGVCGSGCMCETVGTCGVGVSVVCGGGVCVCGGALCVCVVGVCV